MVEIRRDYFTDRLTIVDTKKVEEALQAFLEEEKVCPYCAGNEHLTPPAELVLLQSSGSLVKTRDGEGERVSGWSIRVIASRRPIVTLSPEQGYSDAPLYSEPAFGYHYEVVATPDHSATLSTISVEQWANLLTVLQDRVKWLYGKKGVAYVSVFADQNNLLSRHARFEIVTLGRLPPIVEREIDTFQRSYQEEGSCPMCAVITLETGGPRQILSSSHHIVLSPWAPSTPYEFWILPRKHQTTLLKASQKELNDLALVMRSMLGALDRTLNSPPYTIVLHSSSEKKISKQLHWHFEVHTALPMGNLLHIGTGVYCNPVPPEYAANRLGAAARKELAELVGVT